ncbi:MAG: hypothetical protein L6V81_00780 [Clostridium sp.]|nr:MAG: hypothetical protein L6V81_00780 [Clostridium sp.]
MKLKRYIPKLQKASAKIAYYDVMQSFATIAEEHNFVKPTINENSTVEIIKGRHPVVESVISTEYIDNDIIMNENTNILIITGPNMSGKKYIYERIWYHSYTKSNRFFLYQQVNVIYLYLIKYSQE